MKLTQTDIDHILEDVQGNLKKLKLTQDQNKQFTDSVYTILESYREYFPEDTEIQYKIRKRFGKVFFELSIPGEAMNPSEKGSKADEINLLSKISSLIFNPFSNAHYSYSKGTNIITISAQNDSKEKDILTNPMVVGAILGLVLGLICQHIPSDISTFLIKDIATPIQDMIISMITGIMAPFIFLSLLTSITTLDSIDELNKEGSRLFKRFFIITIFITGISLLLTILIYPVLGKESVAFDPKTVVDLFLSIVPTDLFSPFGDNNFAQIAILGVVMGAALLIVGKKVPDLPPFFIELRDWFMEIMNMVLKLMPAVPFFSIFIIAAEGSIGTFIKGWKYIAATYFCMVLTLAIKLIKVSVRCKVGIPSLLKKIKPLVAIEFATGNDAAGLEIFKDISKNRLGVDPDFHLFWYPFSEALLYPSFPIRLIPACFMVAKVTGMSISPEFLLVLILLTVQLTLASPGFIPGLTILFKSVGLPSKYIGMFTAYSVFIHNFSVGYGSAYRALEEVEAAMAMGHLDLECLRKEG